MQTSLIIRWIASSTKPELAYLNNGLTIDDCLHTNPGMPVVVRTCFVITILCPLEFSSPLSNKSCPSVCCIGGRHLRLANRLVPLCRKCGISVSHLANSNETAWPSDFRLGSWRGNQSSLYDSHRHCVSMVADAEGFPLPLRERHASKKQCIQETIVLDHPCFLESKMCQTHIYILRRWINWSSSEECILVRGYIALFILIATEAEVLSCDIPYGAGNMVWKHMCCYSRTLEAASWIAEAVRGTKQKIRLCDTRSTLADVSLGKIKLLVHAGHPKEKQGKDVNIVISVSILSKCA